jgi:hypothetical protein
LLGAKADDDIIWYFKTDGDKKEESRRFNKPSGNVEWKRELNQEMESRNKSQNSYWTW